MSLRRAGAGTFRLLRAYATESAAQYGAQHSKQLLRQLPAALQVSHLPCPLTPHSQRHNAWWQSQLQHSASVDLWRQLATTPDSSSSGGKDKEDKSKPQLPDAEVRSLCLVPAACALQCGVKTLQYSHCQRLVWHRIGGAQAASSACSSFWRAGPSPVHKAQHLHSICADGATEGHPVQLQMCASVSVVDAPPSASSDRQPSITRRHAHQRLRSSKPTLIEP